VKKQTSYKVLMGLVVLMLFLQTVHNIGTWYIAWLGFIYYGDAPAQALEALEVDGTTSLSLHIISSILDLLTTLRLSIADSIMVSARPSLPTKLYLLISDLQLKVWRCWIICNRSWRATMALLVLNIVSIGIFVVAHEDRMS
jgi:hypothetical protein